MKDVTGGMTDLETKAGEIAKEALEDNKDLPTQEVIEILRLKLIDAYSGTMPESLLQYGIDQLLASAKRTLGVAEGDSENADGESELEQTQIQKMMEVMMPIQSLGMFHMQLVQQDKDPQYYGDLVEPGDAEQVLMTWKDDQGRYNVIYGDLTFDEDVAPEDLPETVPAE